MPKTSAVAAIEPEPEAKPLGRPSKFTPELVTTICDRIALGETLASICRDQGMPDRSVVYDWLKIDPDFSQRFASARAQGFDAIAEECLEIADDTGADFEEVEEDLEDQAHGGALKRSRRENPDSVQRSRLRIDTRLKLLSKWDPKRYGDRQQHDINADITVEARKALDPRLLDPDQREALKGILQAAMAQLGSDDVIEGEFSEKEG